jgi:hypothetical protein
VSNDARDLESEMNLNFPMITISLSYDDADEPIHVDLGSVPPFVAMAVFERVLDSLHNVATGPKITFKGSIIAQPITAEEISFQHLFDIFNQDDDSSEE